jgi:hypothetical protein
VLPDTLLLPLAFELPLLPTGFVGGSSSSAGPAHAMSSPLRQSTLKTPRPARAIMTRLSTDSFDEAGQLSRLDDVESLQAD